MKKMILLIVILFTSITIKAVPVKYIGCTPENGSSISSFDFILNFDIEEAVAALGSGEWGLGYTGSISNGRYVSLYEGSQSDDNEIATALTENFSGKSEGFVVNGSSIPIKFPIDLKPEVGKTYTLVIRNSFAIFQSGKPTPKSDTYLKFESDPLILTFTGAAPTSSELLLQNVSVTDGTRLTTLKEVSYSFNENITLSDNATVSILEGTETVYKSIDVNVSADNAKVLCVKFPEGLSLYNGHNYKLLLPTGIVSLASDNSVFNNEYIVNIEGGAYKYYTIKSALPRDESVGLFSSAEILYNVPQGTTIKKEGISADFSIKLYKNAISDDNFIISFYGKQTDDGTGIVWDLSKFSYEPSTHYVLFREEGLGRLYGDGVDYSEWTNVESIIHFSTPSVAEAGLAPMEFQAPVFGQHGKDVAFTPGSKVRYIQNVEIALNDLRYDYNGIPITLWITPESKFLVYDVSTGEDNLIAEGHITLQTRETSTSYYSVVCLPVNRTFFNGRKYKIVIPEGQVSVSSPIIQNYVKNSLWSVEFEGSAPTDVNLISCTLQDNAELSALPVVIWEFEGEFVQNEDLRAILHSSYEIMGKPAEVNAKINTITSLGNNVTRVAMLNYNWDNGGPTNLLTTRQYEVILPEGIIYYENDPSIKNKELRYTIIPVEAQSNEKNEFVNLTVSINGLATASQKTVKDQPVVITLTPSTDWKVVELTRNGSSVIDFIEDGSYETPALTEDTAIEARVEYEGLWAVESTTGVWEISDSKISIFAEDGRIVVSGATHENQILVYGVNGTLIKSVTPEINTDVTTISVEPGNIYIVIVDGVAAKLQL